MSDDSQNTQPVITRYHILIIGLVMFAVAIALIVITNRPDKNEVSALTSTSTLTLGTTPASTKSIDDQNQPQGKIVFTCQITRLQGQDQICIINADGTDFQRLTDDTNHSHFFPSPAPDGKSVIFASNRTGVYEIYAMDLNGDMVQISRHIGELFAPEISPDGERIIFTKGADFESSSIWVMNRDGSNAHPIHEPPGGGAWDPVWSPDGSQILFAGGTIGRPQLYRMNSDGSDVRQITNIDGLRGRNDWSSDGATLATYQGEGWDREIILLNSEGTNIHQITNGGTNLAPSFSPDGNWITFTSYMDNYKDENGCEIYIMRTDGSDIRRLTDNNYCDWQPRWGP